ncbi:MAG TPA: rhodanese-like domain-containing protein [Aquaticitalea sp.]|nr:rhodanese-like domain-containing protein [Aquaticitalea sp.]HNU59628.1 rhodanese-like domain-containing protein [Aquaticitalea sp.]
MLGGTNDSQLTEFLKNGAVMVDVRSVGEYSASHVKGSINIPLDKLSNQLGKLKKDKPVVVFCASGMRSASAKGILQRNGFSVINGGSWKNVQSCVENI